MTTSLQSKSHWLAAIDGERWAKAVAHFMRNKNQIGLIVAAVTVMLLSGYSTNRGSQREVTYSAPPPLTNLDPTVNDRSTWIDGPPASTPSSRFGQ